MPWRYESLKNKLREQCGFDIEYLCRLDQYDSRLARRVLAILLEWACIPSIQLGRDAIAEVPRDWLKDHLPEVVRQDFDYRDDWNYRRLLELTAALVPEAREEIIALNAGTDDPELLDVMADFS